MNLLFICPHYPESGGVETVTELLASFFRSQAHTVKILTLQEVEESSMLLTMPGPLNSIENRAFIHACIQREAAEVVFNQGAFLDLKPIVSNHPKVLFISTLHSRPFWEVYKFVNSRWNAAEYQTGGKLQSIKVLVRHLLGIVHPFLTHPHLKAYYRGQIEAAHRFVVLDEAFKRELEVRLYKGKPQPTIVSIQNPLAMEESLPNAKQKEVLYVGRLTDEPKRVDRLLRIWSSLWELVPDWRLRIVGEGEERSNLERLASTLHLGNITFEGRQDPLPYYRSASILCLTSTYEGSPMVIPEAQRQGAVPIVFGSVASFYSLIDNEINGVIVPAFDEEAFAEELFRLLNDEQLRATMAEQAVRKVASRSLDLIGNQWLELLATLQQDARQTP